MSEISWIRIEPRSGKTGNGGKTQSGSPLLLDGDVLTLYERQEVHVFVDVDEPGVKPSATLDALPLLWGGPETGFLLHNKIIARWVGGAELTITAGARTRTLWVEVEPHTGKAKPQDWLRMLRDLEMWLPSISVGAEGGRRGRVGAQGVSAPLLAEALTPLLPRFAQALTDVVRTPQVSERLSLQDTSLRATGRVDRESVRWVGRHPGAAQWFRADEPGGPEPRIPQRRAVTHHDHPANRHVAWLVPRVLAELGRVHDALVDLASHYGNDSFNNTGTWCRARAGRLAEHLHEIERLWASSSLCSLPPRAAQTAALESLIDHPSYARIHQLGRLLLSPRFRLPESDARAAEDHPPPVRASFHLYELWTFLFVQRSLALHLAAPDWQWQPKNLAHLLHLTADGTGACFEAHGPANELLEIRFNEWFRTFPHGELRQSAPPVSGVSARCYSLSRRRRPDVLVRWRQPGHEGRWVCLDAKYYDPDGLDEAMQALHTYRDALWMEGYGGRSQAGLLLAPACEGNKAWASPAFRDRFNIGIWTCPPGAAPDAALGAWILSRLRA